MNRRTEERTSKPLPTTGARAALLVFVGALLWAGCGIYSFTGAVIPPHLQTIAIPFVEDQALGAPPELAQRLTELLTDRFTGRTRLVLVADEADADVVLSVAIDRYTSVPAAVTGQEVAARNRVTVGVRVQYLDRVEDRIRLERPFSETEDYNAAQLDQETTAALLALEQLAENIFTAATSDW
jgi:hypothetical protein